MVTLSLMDVEVWLEVVNQRWEGGVEPQSRKPFPIPRSSGVPSGRGKCFANAKGGVDKMQFFAHTSQSCKFCGVNHAAKDCK